MRLFLVIAVLTSLVACSTVQDTQRFYREKESASLYKIMKIKDRKTYFILYAAHNDSTFKIIGDIDTSIAYRGEKVRVGQSYHLDLMKALPPDSLLGMPVAPNLGVKGISGRDGRIIRVEKRTHHTLYNATNLNGLYIKE